MYSKEETTRFQRATDSFLKATDKGIPENKIEGLRDVLRFHEYRYYILNDPLISDYEYDQLFKALEKIEKENPLIKIIYTLSQDLWENEKGRISRGHVEKYIQDPYSKSYMIAGGEKMVENMEDLLANMGIDSSKIRVDIFTGY